MADAAISCLPGGGSSSLAALHYSMSSAAHHSPLLLADVTLPSAGRQHHKQLAPAGGRAGKRRSRASKRAPTTYISTDPANFRIMVQHVTGVQQADDDHRPLLLDSSSRVPAAGDEASALEHHHQLQQPCFPTLDSWNVMYEPA